MTKSFVHSARYCRKPDERVRRFLHQVGYECPALRFDAAGVPTTSTMRARRDRMS